jgi:diguanylate cyclase (GGDEF)-like protein
VSTTRRIARLTTAAALALGLAAAGAALGAAAAAAPTPAPAAPSLGGIGLRLLDAPRSARDDPRAQLYIVDHLAPDTVIRRRVEVANSSSSAVNIVVYAAAASIAAGSFLGAAGLTPNDLSTWTSIVPSVLSVPAHGKVTATVTIAVPRNAAPGEQYGVIWAEARSAPSGGVVQVSRVGIRLYLSVGPGGAPAADFSIDSLTATRGADGRPAVLASVHNSGGRALDMNGTLRLSGGPGGLSAGPFPATLGVTLAIGATEAVTIVLDPRLPAGPWDAEITLGSGLLERRSTATITFPDIGAAAPVRTVPARPGWLFPAVGAALLLLVIAVLVVVLRRHRSRTGHRDLASHTRAEVAVAEPPPALDPLPEQAEDLLPALSPGDPATPERRRARKAVPRLDARPLTVDDIAAAPYHWQIALPGSHDALTDLANRSLFEDEVQFSIDTFGGDRLCLMLINVDDFAGINDSVGRDGGDAVLIAVAERLRRAVRPRDLIARLAGDDFAILFEDVDRADVNTIAHRMLRTVREPLMVDGHRVRVHASLGVAPTLPADDAGVLMRHAATALAEAKNASRVHFAWYTEAVAPRSS